MPVRSDQERVAVNEAELVDLGVDNDLERSGFGLAEIDGVDRRTRGGGNCFPTVSSITWIKC